MLYNKRGYILYIKKSLLILSFCFFAICSVYAGNIGRNVYSVYSESLAGSNFNPNLHIDDSMRMWPDGPGAHGWGGGVMSISSMTAGGVEEGLVYTRCYFPTDSGCWISLCFVDSSEQSQAKDMSAYYNGTLKFLVRVNKNVDWNNLFIGLTLNGISFKRPLANLSGFDTSKVGYWQEVSMVLNESTDDEITSENLKTASCLFSLSSSDGISDSDFSLDFDYIRWIKPGSPGGFSVKLKKLSDSSIVSASSITWDSSKFQQGWQVAEQFLEIDYDIDSSTRSWNVKLYTDNGDKSRNGLYANKSGKDYVMTMCWRASENALPYNDYNGDHTLQIAQGHNSADNYDYLYDSGSSSTVFAPWLYMQDLATLTGSAATDKDRDYSTVMGHKKGGNSGYHGYSGEYGNVFYSGYYSGSKINLYLGANCNVSGGLRYIGNIVVALEYE